MHSRLASWAKIAHLEASVCVRSFARRSQRYYPLFLSLRQISIEFAI